MDAEGDSDILVEVTGAVGRITLDAPDRLNAVDAAMCAGLASAVRALDADPAVRAIALTGAGRGFCSGAALVPGAAPTGGTLHAGGDAVRALLGARTPVVAVVHGVAAGIGVSFALASDYVLAGEAASFMLAFTRIGLMPDGGATALVTASIGRARAMRMALTGEKVPARTAEHWGLIAECVPDEALTGRADALLDDFAGGPGLALARTKAAINAAAMDVEAAVNREETGQVRLLETQDFAEGLAAFTDKRTARFRGR